MKKKKQENQIDMNYRQNVEKKEEQISISINKIEEKITYLNKEQKNIRLRYLAKIDNLTKNNKKEIKVIQKRIFKNFLKSIFPVIDKIDYLINKAKNTHISQNSIIEGIILTQNMFEKNLKSWNINKINQVNIPFNPIIHEIIENKKQDNLPNKNLVKSIIQNGYIFKKKIIKKAIVGL